MADYNRLPLIFLHTENDSSISGATRFQKLVFIGQQEQDKIPEVYSYHADKFGPFSPELHGDLNQLHEIGLIEKNTVTNEVGNERFDYGLTDEGIQKARGLLKHDKLDPVFDTVQMVKKEWNNKPLPEVLQYVYHNYQEYTTESELDLEQLFDPDTRSQFLKEDREFAGSEPGEWKKMNPSADELFSL